MNKESSQTEHYYQTIARLLFRLRGTSFILSGREIDVIEEWEERHIPLNIVLEGIKSAYEYFRMNTGMPKNFTLSFCQRFVSTAHNLNKERKVGKKSVSETRSERVKKIKEEVKIFINNISKEVSYLKEFYLVILNDLSADKVDEEILESRDEQVDHLLLEHATQNEMEKYRQEAVDEYNITQESEKNQIAKRKFLKTVRERYKIPYISFFYY
ncbi:MAG: hypothetical protein ACOC5G_01830 [Acidobacteriota bacterium]